MSAVYSGRPLVDLHTTIPYVNAQPLDYWNTLIRQLIDWTVKDKTMPSGCAEEAYECLPSMKTYSKLSVNVST